MISRQPKEDYHSSNAQRNQLPRGPPAPSMWLQFPPYQFINQLETIKPRKAKPATKGGLLDWLNFVGSRVSQTHYPKIQAVRQAKTHVFANGRFCADFRPLSRAGCSATPKGKVMSHTTQIPNQITGARRISLHMLTLLDQADRFAGLPRGTAKPLRLLGAFQEAEPYLGLPAHAFKLVSWLVKQTQPQDWEEGSRPIAWPSARRQQEFLGLSPGRVKALNRALFEAGIFVMRDNEQGKRYGRRGPDGRIIEAFGFDLSPLAQRYDEFVRLAAAAKLERERMKDGRRRVTLARRAIRQIGEQFALLDALPAEWVQLEADTAGAGPRRQAGDAIGRAGAHCKFSGTAQSRGRTVAQGGRSSGSRILWK